MKILGQSTFIWSDILLDITSFGHFILFYAPIFARFSRSSIRLFYLLTKITLPRFTLDLVEVFFQIVHTRIPLLNPEQFRSRLQLQPSASPTKNIPPLHPALVAVVIAWGTKFSEHPLLIADRKRPSGQSLMAKTMIDRARDLAEALKVHRLPSSDHVVIALLIEPLQSRKWLLPLSYGYRKRLIMSQKILTIRVVRIQFNSRSNRLIVFS